MPLPRRTALRLLALEARDTPANVALTGGTLVVTNNRGAVAVTQNANGTFTVVDNGVNYGSYAVSNGVSVTTGNLADAVSVTLATGKSTPGTLTVTTGNGNDVVVINGGGSGKFGGGLQLNLGLGNDQASVGVSSSIGFGGASTIAADAGLDAVTVADATFGNSVSVGRANTFNVGVGGTTKVNGALVVNNAGDGGVANAATLGAGVTVAGSTAYTGGTGADAVAVAAGAQLGTVPGTSVVVNAGEGDSTFTLAGNVGSGSSANVSFVGGNNFGTDSVSIAGTATVTGNVSLTMNQGAAAFDFTGNFTVGGDFNLTAGDTGYDLGTFNGKVGNNVSVTLGAGDDSVDFGANDAAAGTPAAIGGTLVVATGDGGDTVRLNLTVGTTATVNLGAGSDSFTATDPDCGYGAATIDLGVDSDIDTGTVTTALAPFTTFLHVGGDDVTTAI